MTRFFAAAVATVAAVLACAGAAMGATPFNAGSGDGHDLAVGSDGTGFVVWIQNDGAEDEIGYCRVAAGGGACNLSTPLEFPDATADAPNGSEAQVFTPAPNEVVIVASCTQCGSTGGVQDRTFRFVSTDNGATFPTVQEIGDGLRVAGQSGYLASGGIVLGVEGGEFMAMNFPGIENSEFTLGGGFPFVYNPAVVPGPDASTVVHAVDDLDNVKYAVFNDPGGAGITPAELNNVTNWDSGKLLSGASEEDNSEISLSSGSQGVVLTYGFFIPSAGGDHLGLRRFDATTQTFGPPAYVEGPNSIDNEVGYPHHSQDGGGRLHAVWRSLYDGGRLRYIRSDDGGATWTPAANLATHDTFIDPIVEAGPAGTGFAAWRNTGSSSIRVVPIDPIFEADPTAPPGPGGGGDVPGDPTITDLGIGDTTLAPGEGTTFTFGSSEGGRAVLTFRKRVKGLKIRQRGRRRCVPRTRRRLQALRRRADSRDEFRRMVRQRRCKTWKRVGEIRQDVVAGRNEIVWNGRVAGRRLSPGLYQAQLVITDVAGNVSRTERLRFRVRRRR